MNVDNGQQYFDLIICDFDTPLFQAAKFVQEDYVVVTNKSTGQKWEWNEFRNKTEFQGRNRTGEVGGWLGEINKFFGTSHKRDEFEIEQFTRLKPDIVDHLAEAEFQFACAVKQIKNLGVAEDYRLCIGGENNFRYNFASILPYKGERKEKPILFSQLRDKVLEQYKSKLIIAEGNEADDVLGIYGTQNQTYFRKTGKYKYLLGYIDKDIKQIWGPTIFLNKKEEGIKFITPFEAAHHFAYQCLKGDLSVDNIEGLPDLTPEIREKYGVRKGTGCGEAGALKVLEGCTEIKELFERVLECYQAYYGDRYMFFLRENALLLWMQRKPEQRFDIFTDLFDKLEINYGKENN